MSSPHLALTRTRHKGQIIENQLIIVHLCHGAATANDTVPVVGRHRGSSLLVETASCSWGKGVEGGGGGWRRWGRGCEASIVYIKITGCSLFLLWFVFVHADLNFVQAIVKESLYLAFVVEGGGGGNKDYMNVV